MKIKVLFGLLALMVLIASCGRKKKNRDNNPDKPSVEIVNNVKSDPALKDAVKNYFAEKDTFSTVEI